MWWPFAKRWTRVEAPIKSNLPVRLPDDLAVFSNNDACIKLWLPEKLSIALEQLSGATEQSRPDVLRWIFFEHVYGRPAFETLKAWKRKKDEEERRQGDALYSPLDSQVKFSPKRHFEPERTLTAKLLGKSIDDFKLWLPGILKTELKILADFESLGLSDYLRKTLVRQLLGESFHHEWRTLVGKLPEEVLRFENSLIV